MDSTGKYWIPIFNFLEKNNIWVTLSHPKYTKPQKGNKTDCKDAKWICDLYMCGMVRPSFIPPADYRRIKARRGHKKAIIAICRMILTAIWHILTDLKPYTPEGYLEARPLNKEKVLTTSQALNLLKQRGYIIKDDAVPIT